VFVAGAYVFPGGAVDAADSAGPTLELTDPTETARLDRQLSTEGAVRFSIAAIREAFEEAGVLLARDPASGRPAVIPNAMGTELDADRRAVLDGTRSLADVARARGLELDTAALEPVARWITPPGGPRRYDTWFFVAAAPEGHAYVHDDVETIASTWVRPADALARARSAEIDLIFPTFRSLQMLAAFDSSAELLDAVRSRWTAAHPMRTESPEKAWVLDIEHGADLSDAAAHSTSSHGRRGA
jgi:8-oxo-dGTP pyrophosphatase MutT (NUDIX family)